MATARIMHEQREQEVLTDLEKHFPNFAGQLPITLVDSVRGEVCRGGCGKVPNYLLSISGQDATDLNAIQLNRSNPDAGDCP